MAGINKVILVGNLGRDPEVKTLESGTKVAQFSLATNESFKDKDGNWQDKTEWHNIVMWRYLAEKAEANLKKGTQIYLEGKIRTRQWTDQNNQTRYTTDIIAEKFIMLGSRNDSGFNAPPLPTEESYSNPQKTDETPSTDAAPDISAPQTNKEPEDDLPF